MPHTLQGFKAELFKALAHPARIKILEYLRSGERTVSELQVLLDLESSTVSQQLAILRARSIVEGRKQGTSVYYRVPDPLIFDLLDVARRIFANHVVGLQAMADEDPDVSIPVSAVPITSTAVTADLLATASDAASELSVGANPAIATEVAGADRS